MADYPPVPATPLLIDPASLFWSVGSDMRGLGSSISVTSTAWSTANNALYIPLYIQAPYLVRRVFWSNGSSAAGNNDFGIYTQSGSRIYSTGSTAVAGASVSQYVTPTNPILLSPGVYFMAFNHDTTTVNQVAGGTFASANTMREIGCYQQALGSVVLPATATFAVVTTVLVMPGVGITRTASGF